ncbi:hypothetical protein NDU88_003684 [Pleurodeles waltl]|uniref:Uncharacterized protein n=1 Tax=Pleurodeles waltl TaxID=8319 RepID=A0AAV7MRE5_PLEWA|nr:hypothetical protein NDU88_003684 [Pleurodeles waltl]
MLCRHTHYTGDKRAPTHVCTAGASNQLRKVSRVSGARNPADFLLRHPGELASVNDADEETTEAQVQALAQNSCPKMMNLEEIAEATSEDGILARVKQAIENGFWHEFLKNNHR